MAKLSTSTPFDGVELADSTTCQIRHAVLDPVVSVSPFNSALEQCNARLKLKFALSLPGSGLYCEHAKGIAFWTGLDQWFISGIAFNKLQMALKGLAAVSDQSDAWARFSLTGPDADAVMARLCPLDLSPSVLPVKASCRSQFAHMMAIIQRCPDGYTIAVMRSFAKTAIHHSNQALHSIAAQHELE